MYINIGHIKGIPNAHSERLQDAGIITHEDLIELRNNPIAFNYICDETALKKDILEKYVRLSLAVRQLEKSLLRRVSSGYLIFVEGYKMSPEDDEEEACFSIVGEAGQDRPFSGQFRPGPARKGILVPARAWLP